MSMFISSKPVELISGVGKFNTAAMSKFNSSKPVQLISGVGEFNTGVGSEVSFGNDTGHVGVVSIMGMQSSGKSTLMNKCFSTEFTEMNAEEGMTQTTKGIWISKVSFSDANDTHNILLLDCEGSDGSEREKEDSEVFEKRVTLFALASSDVVLINMKCDNVNLHNGASMPLIRNVFEVMVRMFNTPRRITLLFVLRDKNKVPLEKLKNKLKTQLDEIWNQVCRDLATLYDLKDFFKVEVVALSHYEHKEEAFMEEVAELRERIFDVVKKGKLSCQAANFISFAEKNWMDIQKDKVLNLPLNKKSADEEYFMKIQEEFIQRFSKHKDWIRMKEFLKRSLAQNFTYLVTSLIKDYLDEFDAETKSFNKKSIADSKGQLTTRLLEIVEETYRSLLENQKSALLNCSEKYIEEKLEAGDDENLDTRSLIAVFQQVLEDARILQLDIIQDYQDKESEPLEDLKFQLNQHVESALHNIQKRKMLESEKRSELMAAGGVEATDVIPGLGTSDAADAGEGTQEGRMVLQESNISGKLSRGGRKRSTKALRKRLDFTS